MKKFNFPIEIVPLSFIEDLENKKLNTVHETIKELLEDERIPEEIRVEYHRKFIIDSLDKEV